MNKKISKNKKREFKHIFELADWGIKTINTFEDYLADYDSLPSYKKVLSSMIKFKDMYQPIMYGSRSAQAVRNFFTGEIDEINEYRKYKRAEIYMNKRDLIQTFDKTHGKRLVVTSKGHKIFYEEYPLAKLRKRKWNKVWTLIMYDFPEKIRKQRNYIRRRLMDYGFGSPQQSILISPLPLSDVTQKLIEGEEMKEYVWVLKAENVLGMENKEVAKKAWPIDELNDLYNKLLEILPNVKRAKDKKLLDQWKEYFLAVNTKDPYLPFELLPKEWVGVMCESEFVKLGPLGLLRIFFKKLL